MREHDSSVHPTHELMEEAADRALTLDDVRTSFPALWAHLQECDECYAAFQELLRVAHDTGHREGHAEELQTRRAVVMTAIAGVLAVTLLAGGVLIWQSQSLVQGQNDEAVVNEVYRRVSPAVANIQVESAGVTGSGLVFDRDGYVLTNYHVIRDAENDQDIVVQLPGLNRVPSKLVGYDIATDLAVLKVDAPSDRLTVAEFSDSEGVEVGDLAIAIGNPFGLSHSLTVGHISAVERRFMSNDMYAPDIEGVLQTDAAINPGNSGGPLLNTSGQVIGINTRIESPSGGSVGLGFATPSHTALEVAQEIIDHGYVKRPFLGAGGRPIEPALAQRLGLPIEQGLLVQEVEPGSPAAKAGLEAGGGTAETDQGNANTGADVIVAVNGQAIRNQSDLNQLIAKQDIGDTVTLDIVRQRNRMSLEATLTERPPEPTSKR